MAWGILIFVAVAVPLVACFMERAGSIRIAERHHSHHDTYVVPISFTRAIVRAMCLMGAFGLGTSVLCVDGVLDASPLMPLGFCDGFVLTAFVLWLHVCRCKVSIFDDCMVVTPLSGPDVWVRYDRIERLERRGESDGMGCRMLDVIVDGRRAVRIRGIVDLDQILMRIDRFDVLAHDA